MQRHLSMFRRRLLIWSLTLVATHVSAALAQGEPPSPWADERANALVYIEAPVANQPLSVATGFIVNGHGRQQYVATSTHGLLPEATEEELKALEANPPGQCSSLPEGTTLRPGARGTSPLRVDCAYHIGNDVSLIEFFPGASPQPALSLRACDLKAGDEIYLGGFPLGGDRLTMMPGKVSVNGPQGLLAQSVTAPGLSGGPYLTADGDVVAIHRGTAHDAPAYAYILPITDIRTKLETRLPAITEEEDCPKPPAPYEEALKDGLADLQKQLHESLPHVHFDDKPNATLQSRIKDVEYIFDLIKTATQWGMAFDEKRPGVGPVVTIWYRRLVEGSEPPPANDMVLSVTPLTNPPAALMEEDKLVYSSNHINQTPGLSGKYEAFLSDPLKKMARKAGKPIEAIMIHLRYRDDDRIQDARTITLSDPINP